MKRSGLFMLSLALLALAAPILHATPAAAASAPADTAALPAAYSIANRVVLGGDGGWDCLTFDPDAHRLFITRGSHVQVVDLARDTLAGDILNTPGVHGVALVPALGRGFTSNGRDSSVTVFDLHTLATLTTVKLPARGPDVIVYDPKSERVFTFNGGSSNAAALDPKTFEVLGTVALGGRPEFAVADGRGHMYVNLEDSSAIVCFDTHTLGVLSRWPLAPGEGPTGLAMDRVHRRLFSGCDKQLVVLDADSGKRVAVVPIGSGCDGVAFDPGLQRVLTSNGEGTLSVIHEDAPDRYTRLGDAPTQRGARTLALDETTHRVYTVTSQFGETPAPTAERPHPRPSLVPGTFVILALDGKATRPAPH